LADFFTSIYAFCNRTRLLRHPSFQRVFSHGYFAYKRYLEDPFTPLVAARPELFREGHILDVGANIGYTASLFAGVVSPGFRIFAFEPEESNFHLLERTIRERGLSHCVTPLRTAVGEQSGMSDLWLNPMHHADHRMITPTFHGEPGVACQTQHIPMVRLDDFCSDAIPGQPVRFIKIDVQGFEGPVCLGMTRTLALNPGALVGLEYYPKGIEQLGFKSSDILQFFQERAYRLYVLTRQTLLREVRYEDIQATIGHHGYTDLLFSKSDKLTDGLKQ